MTLTKGQLYNKADFDIRFPRTLKSTAVVNGETYFFVTIGGKYNNELKNDGLIIEPRSESEVVQQEIPEKRIVHTFVRTMPEKQYEYIGDVDIIKPYDSGRVFLTIR